MSVERFKAAKTYCCDWCGSEISKHSNYSRHSIRDTTRSRMAYLKFISHEDCGSAMVKANYTFNLRSMPRPLVDPNLRNYTVVLNRPTGLESAIFVCRMAEPSLTRALVAARRQCLAYDQAAWDAGERIGYKSRPYDSDMYEVRFSNPEFPSVIRPE